jgi:hypothetical protein
LHDAFLGGYDICGECNGDGFGCEAMLQVEGGIYIIFVFLKKLKVKKSAAI